MRAVSAATEGDVELATGDALAEDELGAEDDSELDSDDEGTTVQCSGEARDDDKLEEDNALADADGLAGLPATG